MKFTHSLLTLSIAALLSAPLAQSAQPALTGYDSGSTIPYSLLDETETRKPWIAAPAPKKKPLRPATAENLQQKQRLAALEKSLAEQQRINQEVLAVYQVEKQQLQQQLTALTAEQANVAEQRAQLDKLQGELSSAQNQHRSSQQESSELRMQLVAHQLLVDTQAMNQSTLSAQLANKDASLLTLSQQLEAMKNDKQQQAENHRAAHQQQITQLQTSLAAVQQKKSDLEQQIATRQAAQPTSHEQKLSYANGVAFANNIAESLRKQTSLGVEPDRAMVLNGIKDAFDKRVVLNSEEMRNLVTELDLQLNNKLQVQHQEKKKIAQQQKISGDKLIKATKQRKGIKQLEGAYYVVTQVGNGKKLTTDSTVDLLIIGKLADGTVFDNSGQRKELQRVKLDSLIPIITKILSQVTVGSQVDIIVPPEMAFGDDGIDKLIPAGATLAFNFTVVAAL